MKLIRVPLLHWLLLWVGKVSNRFHVVLESWTYKSVISSWVMLCLPHSSIISPYLFLFTHQMPILLFVDLILNVSFPFKMFLLTLNKVRFFVLILYLFKFVLIDLLFKMATQLIVVILNASLYPVWYKILLLGWNKRWWCYGGWYAIHLYIINPFLALRPYSWISLFQYCFPMEYLLFRKHTARWCNEPCISGRG